MMTRRTWTSLATMLMLALATAAWLPAGSAQAAPELAGLEAAETVHLLAGGEQAVPVTLTFDTLGAGIASATARLDGATGSAAETTLAAETPGGLVWSGTLMLPSSTPPGDHTIRALATATDGTTAETTSTLEVAPLAAVAIDRSTVDFGEGSPNTRLGPMALTVRNAGNIALDTALTATDLAHEEGLASIGADRITVHHDGAALGALGAHGPLGLGGSAPGEEMTLDLWLQLPSGAEQWLPGGAYRGTIDVDTKEVSS